MEKCYLKEDFLNDNIRKLVHLKNLRGEASVMYGTSLRFTEKGNLRMTLYNLLGEFDGHYECCVNLKNFDYRVRKYANYGGLCSIAPSDDSRVYKRSDLTDRQRTAMDGYVSYTIKLVFYPSITGYSLDVMPCHLQKLVFGYIESDLFDAACI